MQLEIGMSTNRYLPASGTAGFARSLVNGKSLVPAPPPIITDSTLLVLGDMRLPCVIKEKAFLPVCFACIYSGFCRKRKRHSGVGVTVFSVQLAIVSMVGFAPSAKRRGWFEHAGETQYNVQPDNRGAVGRRAP